MAQGYKGEIPFAELCQRIYEGFGQWAVINFVQDRQRNGYLQDLSWATCPACEEYSPIYKTDCLVCGQTLNARRNNEA